MPTRKAPTAPAVQPEPAQFAAVDEPLQAVPVAPVVMPRGRRRAFVGLAALGILVLLVELVRYWLTGHSIHGWPVAIGCIVGFVGFYGLDPKEARDGGAFIVSSAVSIIGTIRSGRRSTDVRAVVAPSNPEDVSGAGSGVERDD